MADDIGSDEHGDHTFTEVDIAETIGGALQREIEQDGSVNDRILEVDMSPEYDPGHFFVVDRHGRRWAVGVREL